MVKSEKGVDTVSLNPKQLKLFRFLRSNTANPLNWPSLEEISDKLNISEKEANKLISSLRSEEGIVLSTKIDKKEDEKTLKYGLASETLGVMVKSDIRHKSRENGVNYSVLYLAEPCFGTKAFDERYVMKGLALCLEVNKIAKDLQGVIIQGGVIPHVPPHSSKLYNWDLKFLGKVKRKGSNKSISEDLLEEKIETDWEQEYYEKFINDDENKKITNLTDAFSAAEEQISPFMNSLPEDAFLRIQLGEEDRKNIEHLEATYIQEWAKEKSKKIGLLKNEIYDDAEEIFDEVIPLYVQKTFLERSLKSRKLSRKDGQTRKNFKQKVYDSIPNFLKNIKEDVDLDVSFFWNEGAEVLGKDLEEMVSDKEEETNELLNSEVDKAINYLANSGRDIEKVKERIKRLDKELSKHSKNKSNLFSKLDDLDYAASWTSKLLGGRRQSITWFTSQYPTSSDEIELIFKKAKDKYTQHFYDWDTVNPPVIHVSPRKRILVDTGVMEDISSGKKEEASVDYEVSFNGKKKILMIHNIRHIFSDGVGASAIKEGKLAMNHENLVLKKFFDEEKIRGISPDIVLLGGHQAGGFRVMPWFKESEQLVKGEFVKNQEISYLINLPTLQSIDKLERLVEKGFRNWHTKAYQSGPFASAATIHTEDKEGVNKFSLLETSLLAKFGEKAEEIEVYRKALEERKLGKEQKKKISGEIKRLRSEVKINYKKIECAGDFHGGAPDHPDRFSKDQFIKAAQSYQIRHGLPDMVSWDEVLHGVEERIFNSASRYLGMIPEKFNQEVITPIMENKDISHEKKAELIAKESMRNQRAITIHNSSEQKHWFKLMCKPYADRILKNGGELILISGNHHNKSQKTSDEALELANQFPEKYVNDKKIHIFGGKGNDVGVGALRLEGGQTFFGMHKFPERQDEIYGIMAHLKKMNNDADIVFAGDRHQTGAGYADGHLVVLHPGMEPINTYVPLIGKPAGLRGFNNVFYDPDKRGAYQVDFILNPTLEKIVEKEKIR